MMSRVRSQLRRVLGSLLGAAALFACGSRTALDISRPASDAAWVVDAALASDSASPFDAATLPDSTLPQDTGVPSDSGAPCGDGGLSEIAYALDESGALYRYDPATTTYVNLGPPNCGEDNVPWTMTVSRENAYILYTGDWAVYAVDLTTLGCSPTAFQSGQLGLDDEYGIAVASVHGVERFFVYGEPNDTGNPILATSDLSSFVLTKVGDILPVPPDMSFPVNLVGDAMGHLYAFSPEGLLQQIDAATGSVLQSVDTGVMATSTWATLPYGADVLLFVDSRVDAYDLTTRTRLSDKSLTFDPVGAGGFPRCPGE